MVAKGQTQSCDKLELIKKSRTRPERGERLAVERDWMEVAVAGSLVAFRSHCLPYFYTNCTVSSRCVLSASCGYVNVHKHQYIEIVSIVVETGPRNSYEDNSFNLFVLNLRTYQTGI